MIRYYLDITYVRRIAYCSIKDAVAEAKLIINSGNKLITQVDVIKKRGSAETILLTRKRRSKSKTKESL